MEKNVQIPENILTRFVESARETIGENLLGVYLHGSAAMGCFNPKSSDLDLLVGVKEALDDSTKRHFMDRVVALHEEFVKLCRIVYFSYEKNKKKSSNVLDTFFGFLYSPICPRARVVKLADTLDLGSSAQGVRVQIPSLA